MDVHRRFSSLLLVASLAVLGACSSRPAGYAAFQSVPQPLDTQGRFDGIYVGEGEARRCTTYEGEVRTYDPPVVAGVVQGGQFTGNLDGCRVSMDVYADGSVRGWTYIRTHRFVPITYSLFAGRVADGRIAGQFDQVLQGSELRCDRGPVVLTRRDIAAELARRNETLEEAIDDFSPGQRCRTGGFQFP